MPLPQPSAEEQLHSEQLALRIRDEIAKSGPVSFARYMQRALYEPGLGYYMSGIRKFGAGGDFVTAPELSPLFSGCLAAPCLDVMRNLQNASLLEFGAGNGVMAAEILRYCQEQDHLPRRYYIVELSAELRRRQRSTLKARVPWLLEHVEWLDSLAGLRFNGVVLANEVLDAMPVERFVKRHDQTNRLAVDWDDSTHAFHYVETVAGDTLHKAVEHVESGLPRKLAGGYLSEINLMLGPWLNTLAGCLEQGVVLLIDYGYPRREYYLPERDSGTLMCHFRQRAHDDPLILTGLQDITAHVDFTAVAEAAANAAFDVLGFTSQARFLLECGLETLLQDAQQSADPVRQINLSQQTKTLLLPGQMGERFKVIALGKRYNQRFAGFSHNNDQRQYL